MFKILIGVMVVVVITYAIVVYKKSEKAKQPPPPVKPNLEPTVKTNGNPLPIEPTPPKPIPTTQPIETGGVKTVPPAIGALIDLNLFPAIEPTYSQQPIEPNNSLPSTTGGGKVKQFFVQQID